MRIIFMGSAALAVPSLKALLGCTADEVIAVISQPDRPAGRRRRLTSCPLKAFAEQQGLHVMTPEKIGDPSVVEALAGLNPDLIVVVAYGQYIPSRVINLAPCGAINVHPSLLPCYRGASPIQWAIINGDEMTGVSIIYLAKRMDAGDIIRQAACAIDPEDTSATLHDRLAGFGADLLLEAIEDIRLDAVVRQVQDEALAIEVRKLTKEDGRIDWTMPAEAIRNRIRAFDPWPGTFSILPDGEPLRIWKAAVEDGAGPPGQLLDDQLLVAAGENALRLLEVQASGGKRMPAAAYLNGRPIAAGARLS